MDSGSNIPRSIERTLAEEALAPLTEGELGKGSTGVMTSGIVLLFHYPQSGSLITSTDLLCALQNNFVSIRDPLVQETIRS